MIYGNEGCGRETHTTGGAAECCMGLDNTHRVPISHVSDSTNAHYVFYCDSQELLTGLSHVCNRHETARDSGGSTKRWARVAMTTFNNVTQRSISVIQHARYNTGRGTFDLPTQVTIIRGYTLGYPW